MGRTTADRTVAVLAAAALALGLAACSDAGPEEPSTQPTLTTATPTDELSQAIEPRDPLPLTATDAFEERYRCFTELADARWLAGESEGLDVGAALVGSGDRLVVVSHQADKDACSVMFLARRLVDDGYLVAVPVHRGGDPVALILGVVAHARADGVEHVVLGGGSMGGVFAIAAAAELQPAPDGVFALAPPEDFDPPGPPPRVEAVPAAAALTSPLLLMVAEHDTALVQPAHDIAAAAGTEPVVTPGGGHAFDVLAVDGVLPQLLDFIAEPR